MTGKLKAAKISSQGIKTGSLNESTVGHVPYILLRSPRNLIACLKVLTWVNATTITRQRLDGSKVGS